MENRRDLEASCEAQEPRSATVPQTSFRVAWEKVCEIVECESRYSPRIQRQFRLAHLRDATNEKGDESSSTFFPPPLPYCLVAISQETRETLTERVLLEKFVAKRLFCHSYHLIRITLIYFEFYFYVLFKSLHMRK